MNWNLFSRLNVRPLVPRKAIAEKVENTLPELAGKGKGREKTGWLEKKLVERG